MKPLLKIYNRAYQKQYILMAILSIVFMIADVGIALAIPRITKGIIFQLVNGNNDPKFIMNIGIILIAIAFGAVFTTILNNIFAQNLSTKIAADLRRELFEKVQALSFSNIDNITSGTLMTVISNDTNHIQQVITMSFRIIIRSPLTLIGAIIMAFLTNGNLFFIIIFAVISLGTAITYILKKATPAFMRLQDQIDDLNTRLIETVSGAREIKSFVTEEEESNKFETVNSRHTDYVLIANKRISMMDPVIILISNISIGAVLLVASYFVSKSNGNIKAEMIASISVYVSYLQQIIMSLMMLSMVAVNISRSAVSAQRIDQVLMTNIDVKNNDMAINKEISGDIEYRDVSFGYSDDENDYQGRTLNNLNFKIKANQTIGIIGSTGSGKTSLVQLLPRLYDVSSGQVLIDGVDVRDYDLKSLRKQISYVTQEALIFSGTIKSNIIQGKLDATDDAVLEAVNQAVLNELIEKSPQGLYAEVNQNGSNLSGGQKQRLALARALIRKPKILILDDSMSAVDAKSEARIKENLKILNNQTTIVVAQKISSIINCDNIIVLDNTGNLDGFGNHQNLLKTSKVYQEIYISQFGGLENE